MPGPLHTTTTGPTQNVFSRRLAAFASLTETARLARILPVCLMLAGQLTATPGAGVLGQHQQEGQWKQKRLQAEQNTPTSPSSRPQQSCETLSARWGLSRPPAARVHRGTWDYLSATCPGSEPHFPPPLPISADAETPTSPAGAGTCCGAPGAHLCGRCDGVGHPGWHQPCTRCCQGGGPAQVRSQSHLGPSSRSSCGVAGTCNLGGPSCVGPAAALPPPRRGASHSRSASCSSKGRRGMAWVPTAAPGAGPHPPRHSRGGPCVPLHLSRHQAGSPLARDRALRPARSSGEVCSHQGHRNVLQQDLNLPTPSSSYFPSLRACVSPLPLGLSQAGGEEAEPSREHTRDKARLPENRQGYLGHLGFPDPQKNWQNPCDPP